MATYKRKRVKVGSNTWLNQTISNKGVRTTSMSTKSKTGRTKTTVNRTLNKKPTKITTTRNSNGWITRTTSGSSTKTSSTRKSKSSSKNANGFYSGSNNRRRKSSSNHNSEEGLGSLGIIFCAFVIWFIYELIKQFLIGFDIL